MERNESERMTEYSKQTESVKMNRTNSQLLFKSNQSKKRPMSTRAIEEYRKLCIKTYSTPNPAFAAILKSDFLELYLSSHNLKEINCMNKIIGKYYYFNEIILAPYNPQKGDPNEKKKKPIPTSSAKQILTQRQIERNKKEIKDQEVIKQQKIYTIVQGISKNLCLSDSVMRFTLFGLTLTTELTSFLSEGLVSNKTLCLFTLSNCQISLDAYEILLKGLLTHESILHIDLSSNGFNDKYANMISRIIARQTQRRDMVIWSYGLRNERPANNDYTKGLVSMNLSDNNFSDLAADCISNALSYDQYIRSIDLSENQFSKESCKKFIHMLRKNTSLLNLDLKDNLGYDPEIHARMVMKISKNIQYLNRQVIDSQYTVDEFNEMKQFINLSFFNVDIPEEVIDMYNNRVAYSNNSPNRSTTNKSLNKNNRIEEKSSQYDNDNNRMQNDEGNTENEYEEEEQKQVVSTNNDVGYLKSKNKKLEEENILLKKELIEMKVLKIHNDISQNKNDKEPKNASRHIESNYNRIIELLSELTDLMNNVETTMEKEKNNAPREKVNEKNQSYKRDNNVNNIIDNRSHDDEKIIGEESEDREQASSKRKSEETKVIASSSKDKEKEKEKEKEQEDHHLIKDIDQVVVSLPKKERDIQMEEKKAAHDFINQYRKDHFEAEDNDEEEEEEEYLDEEDMRQNIYNNPYAQQYMMYGDENDDDDDNGNEQFQKKMNKSF